MYTSGPGEAALGASRLLNTPILGAAGAGQVISIIRGEGSHTYGNPGVGGWRGGEAGVGSWGVTFVSGVLGVCSCMRRHSASPTRHSTSNPCSYHFFFSFFPVTLSLFFAVLS